MIVNIKDCYSAARLVADIRRSDRCEVEETVSTECGAGGMVARRPSESVCHRLACQHEIRCTQCDVHGDPCGLVATGNQAGHGLPTPVANAPSDCGRLRRRTHSFANRRVEDGIGKELRRLTRPAGRRSSCTPLAPDLLEEAHHPRVVDCDDWANTVLGGPGQLESPVVLQRLADRFCSKRYLVHRDRNTVLHFTLGIVQNVSGVVDDAHFISSEVAAAHTATNWCPTTRSGVRVTITPRRTPTLYSLPGFRLMHRPIFAAARDSWM